MKYSFLFLLALIACASTNDDMDITDDNMIDETLYFPENDTPSWETSSLDELGWNETAKTDLDIYLAQTGTKAFIVLKNGRIVIEEYFDEHTSESFFPWFSAGKTLTAFTLGIAQQEGYLSTSDKTSDYLGEGWTSMTLEQENDITIRNQLTMTSGGDYRFGNLGCIEPECLRFLDPAGTFWFYHNAFYTLIQPLLDDATPQGFDAYFTEKIRNPIGMNGFWFSGNNARFYLSTARSMARFGLLNLANGNWKEETLLNDAFFTEMTNTSQELNKSYGYLWWLNGKENYRVPAETQTYNGSLIPDAPSDLIAGLGANDQKLYVVPSEGLVIVRLGDNAGMELLGPSSFDNELWNKINAVIH